VTADGKTREVDILDRDLAGDIRQVRIKLADAGLWITTESQAQSKFSQLLNNYPADKYITNCPKPGWYDSGNSRIFITPLGEVIGDVAPTDVFALDENGVAPDCEPGGSYEAWQDAAARCVSVDTRQWGLAQSIGVAGTVVDFLGESSFGINFCGSSSAGKLAPKRYQLGCGQTLQSTRVCSTPAALLTMALSSFLLGVMAHRFTWTRSKPATAKC